jgi:hypothetical protein
MQSLQAFILSGHVVDVMLFVIVVEIVVLSVVRQTRGGGIALLPLIVNIGAGGSLMVALRFALQGDSWIAITACLLAALVFHIADIRLRWVSAERDLEAS